MAGRMGICFLLCNINVKVWVAADASWNKVALSILRVLLTERVDPTTNMANVTECDYK